jgi:hypothetical protein
LHFADRGVLKVGLAADIVVLDEQQTADRATYAAPNQLGVGMRLRGWGTELRGRCERRELSREVAAQKQVAGLDLPGRWIVFIVCVTETKARQNTSRRLVSRMVPGI